MTQFAKNFTFDEVEDKEFKSLKGEKRQIFLKIKQDYKDTIGQKDEKSAKMFSELFPTMKQYVKFHLSEFDRIGKYRPEYRK